MAEDLVGPLQQRLQAAVTALQVHGSGESSLAEAFGVLDAELDDVDPDNPAIADAVRAVIAPDDHLVYDGDLLHEVVIAVCPDLFSDAAARQFADAVLAGLAGCDGVTVTRGPDNTPMTATDWTERVLDRIAAGERGPDAALAVNQLLLDLRRPRAGAGGDR